MDAEMLKGKGNEAFASGNYIEAINQFSKAIQLDSQNNILYSNRSAAYAALHKYKDALDDAEKCISLKHDWVKGYVRKGAALHGLRRYDDAISCYEKGLQIEAGNELCMRGITEVKAAMSRESFDPIAKAFTPAAFQKIQENPQLSLMLLQPDYVKMIDAVISDPSKGKLYLEDKRFALTFMYLSGIKLPTNEDDNDDDNSNVNENVRKRSSPAANASSKEQPKSQVEMTDAQKEALREKEEGNKLYLQKKFDEALEKYQKAESLDPSNTLYILNATAVYYEKGDYEKCISECERGREHGKEHKCDYTIMSKLMTREALCYQKEKKYEEAIRLYKTALVEWRNPETLNKLNACEKEYQKSIADAYINPEIAKEKKEEGNALFKSDKFPEAVAAYSESIKRDPNEHTTYSNRAAAYLKLGAYNDALKDAEKCIELKPDFVKGYARKGHAYFWTKQYNRALQAYDDGLKIDENNADCREGRLKTIMKIQEMATGNSGDGEEAAQRAMQDPEIVNIMQDSYMQLVLREMQNDPTRVQEYMRDPQIAAKISKLITAGIIRFGQ